MFRYALLIFLLLLISFPPYSQENKSRQDYARLYSKAEKLYNAPQADAGTDSLALIDYIQLSNFLNRREIFNDTLIDCYLKCGILKMSKNDQTAALNYFRLAIFVVSQHALPDTLLFKPYLYAGSLHYSLNNLDSAIEYYKTAELINARHPGLNESERLFNKFGALYFETGDYNKSISYFEKALSLVESKKPVNRFFVINYKNNIATALMKLGKNDQALEIFRELLKYDQPADELLYNIGNLYFEKKEYVPALRWLRQIRNLEDEKYNSLIKIFIRLQQYDSARFYLAKAQKLKNTGGSKITREILLKYSGDLAWADGRITESLKDYQLAIVNLDPAFQDTSVNANPQAFTGLQNFLFLFETLVAKGTVLNAYSNGNNEKLIQAMSAYASALSLARHIEKTYFSDDARLFLKTKVNPATQAAVEIAVRLFSKTKDSRFINDAFAFVENNKATVLQAGLKNLELSTIPGLPASLVSEEKKWRTLLAKLNILALQTYDSLSLALIQKKIHETELSLAAVQDKLDENPLYHDLKFVPASTNLDSLQKNLRGNDQAILSYYYTDSSLICFYILKNEKGFSCLPLDKKLFSTITSLRRELQTPEASGRKALQEAGAVLFQQLIAPVYEKINDKKKLVIIPFNEISYVPFEMLLNPADQSLLLRKFAISYNYSASFISNKKDNQKRPYEVLAMAPYSVSTEDLILPALPASAAEINDLPGKQLYGAQASKEKFALLAGQYPVLHLATHAVANDTNLLGSYIEFYGLKKDADSVHRLYEQEIYTLDLKTSRLVILSACETGSGLLVNGEGVMSLSRAFSYAGCKSVVTSLWKADELSTSFICKRLHEHLQKGLAIDEALQKAKIDYLENSEIADRYKNPAYWAHLVLIGDDIPMVEPANHWFIWAILITVFLGVTVLVEKKRNQA
jgi:CHAT domain-containing protein/tetratricopeptide (TPR) repeat protein